MTSIETGGKCPICNEPAAKTFRPFCSGRCKDIDLGRWLKGSYAIPAVEGADDMSVEEGILVSKSDEDGS